MIQVLFVVPAVKGLKQYAIGQATSHLHAYKSSKIQSSLIEHKTVKELSNKE